MSTADRVTIVDAMGKSRRLSPGQTMVYDIIRGESVAAATRLHKGGGFLPQGRTEVNAAAKLVEYGVAFHTNVHTREGTKLGICYSPPLPAVVISGKAAELLHSLCAHFENREDIMAVQRHLTAQIKHSQELYNGKGETALRNPVVANRHLDTNRLHRSESLAGLRGGKAAAKEPTW